MYSGDMLEYQLHASNVIDTIKVGWPRIREVLL